MPKTFHLHFAALKVVQNDFSELLGFQDGEIPEPFPQYIEEAIDAGSRLFAIEGGYSTFDSFSFDTSNNTIKIEDQVFSPSKIVVTQLKRAKQLVLFACTAGAEITEHSKNIAAEGPMLAYVFDVLGSVVVEKAMNVIQEKIYQEALLNFSNISDRFSPGYCEWGVGEQQKLFDLLPQGFCGISLSDSSLMHPIKSVSGILGIGPELKQIGYQCHWCTDKNCLYGKIKRAKMK